ncbi:MAG: PilW family protein [Pseudomonadota bacterium]
MGGSLPLTAQSKRQGGLSLVELMVGVVVGMLTILAIMQAVVFFEGQKRTTTGAANAEENGLLGTFLIERDIRMAGFGLVGTGCTTIRTYNENANPKDFTISGLPVTITQNTPAAGVDRIEVTYSTSAYGSIPATIQQNMPDSSAILRVNNGIGFVQGQLVLISQPPKDCTAVQVSQNGQQTGQANITGPGTQWNLQHNPGGQFTFNPPGGHNIFPAGGYTTGARATNMGSMVTRRYYIQNDNLMMDELVTTGAAAGTFTTQTLVNGIVALRAEYGRDTGTDGYLDVFDNTAPASGDRLVAVRIGLVARVGVFENNMVSPATLPALWSGGPVVNLNSDQRHYRYKSFTTVIPLRNTIWNN